MRVQYIAYCTLLAHASIYSFLSLRLEFGLILSTVERLTIKSRSMCVWSRQSHMAVWHMFIDAQAGYSSFFQALRSNLVWEEHYDNDLQPTIRSK